MKSVKDFAITLFCSTLMSLALLPGVAFVETHAQAKADTTNPSTNTGITQKEIDKLPLESKNYEALLKLTGASAQGFELPGAVPVSTLTSEDYPPERENLPGGGYKIIYRNSKGEEFKQEEFTRAGERTRTTTIHFSYPNRRDALVVIESYGVTGVGLGTREDTIYYDKNGDVIRTITQDSGSDPKAPLTRKVTERGRTRTEQFNPGRGYEEVPAPSTPTSPATTTTPPAPSTPPAQPSSSGQGTTTSVLPDYARQELYFGYSHNRVDIGDEREGFNGFALSFTGNFNRYAGLKAYYSFHTRSSEEIAFDFSSRASIHQGFGGVQFKDNAIENGPVRPFAHLLAGVAHHRFSFETGVGSISDTRTGFAVVAGGGLDFRINDRVSVRTQFDYNPNRIDEEWQHNVRAGFGLVFNFGRRSDDNDDADDGPDFQDPTVAAVPQKEAVKCTWNDYTLGKDTNVTTVKSDKPTVVEVRVKNFAGAGGFEYHCLLNRGTALISYKYTDANGGNQEGKLRVFCK